MRKHAQKFALMRRIVRLPSIPTFRVMGRSTAGGSHR